MEHHALPADPLPPRLRWFAVWSWPRWKQWSLIVVSLLMLYVVSAVPMMVLLNLLGIGPDSAAGQVVAAMYLPLRWAYERFAWLQWLVRWQWNAVGD